MAWILEIDNEAPPVRWQCARCEAPAGKPHAEGCNCTLVEGVEIEDVLDAAIVVEGEEEN